MTQLPLDLTPTENENTLSLIRKMEGVRDWLSPSLVP